MENIIFDAVCDQIELGETVTRACELCEVSLSAFYKGMKGNPDLRARFEASKEIGFEVQADTLYNITDKVRDPFAAKVLSENRKWLLARRHAKVFGDRIAAPDERNGDLTAILREAIARIPRPEIATNQRPQEITMSESEALSRVYDTQASGALPDAPLAPRQISHKK